MLAKDLIQFILGIVVYFLFAFSIIYFKNDKISYHCILYAIFVMAFWILLKVF